jgi:hypothetical protein
MLLFELLRLGSRAREVACQCAAGISSLREFPAKRSGAGPSVVQLGAGGGQTCLQAAKATDVGLRAVNSLELLSSGFEALCGLDRASRNLTKRATGAVAGFEQHTDAEVAVHRSAILLAAFQGLHPPADQLGNAHVVHRRRTPPPALGEVRHHVFYSGWKAACFTAFGSKKSTISPPSCTKSAGSMTAICSLCRIGIVIRGAIFSI